MELKTKPQGYFEGIAEGRKQGMREASEIVRRQFADNYGGARARLLFQVADKIDSET
jgi:flagellar biosynthesis/type III secretory pathway protein FliH